jgi:hypothetical protein
LGTVSREEGVERIWGLEREMVCRVGVSREEGVERMRG